MNGLTLMTLNRKTVLALSVVLFIALWSGVASSADIVTVTSDKNIVEAAQGTGIFTTLLAAAKQQVYRYLSQYPKHHGICSQ